MKNAGMAGAVALVGIGLITIGLGNFVKAPVAVAAAPAPVAVEQGPEEPVIVWYGASQSGYAATGYFPDDGEAYAILFRGWSDGTVEVRKICTGRQCSNQIGSISDWILIASPTEGMSAAADINFDEQVDGADLAFLLSRWGDAPRNPMPPSDCPLGLLNPS